MQVLYIKKSKQTQNVSKLHFNSMYVVWDGLGVTFRNKNNLKNNLKISKYDGLYWSNI